MLKIIKISDIYKNREELSKLEKIKVGGWVKSVRESKEKIFIPLNDGSCLANLQLVFPSDLAEKISKINFGSSLIVSGNLILTPERVQSCELQVRTIDFFNVSNLEYHEINTLPWINSGVLTNLYFLTGYTLPSKLVSERAKNEYKLPAAKPQNVLISDIDLNPTKIVWVMKNSTKGTHVWQLLGTHVWQLLGTDVCENSTLFFALRSIDFKQYASGSIINHLQRSVLMNLKINWVSNPNKQKIFFTILNSKLAKIKDLHSKIKDLLLLKYFGSKKD
ncbi:OB-fold nucleic acid binding domain-containing protein [endosymbiont GvMRE of Glomus versiforme]|uniref:OB-fold nucleic acid binding domain-containing protein n=1 Tax=endosymbiont GvMRE of Glomus versiforme TaxID=2039283 RepID=UPI000EBE4ED4|nr:OB-fold nucleic acid binding domain-containing protein [endosymbiont GvMRE of Glomus versiforme]RHZ37167.1 Asparagine--tRNA ligase [endosymbiont GvMRE of Glomus versiforme]